MQTFIFTILRTYNLIYFGEPEKNTNSKIHAQILPHRSKELKIT